MSAMCHKRKSYNGVSFGLTAKYVKQFGQKNHFEGSTSWIRLSVEF